MATNIRPWALQLIGWPNFCIERRLEKAENLYKLSLSIRRRASHPPLLAHTLTAYAELIKDKGNTSQAKNREDEAKRILDS
ncbi:MAG: hypothetical protein IT342_14980 [Candidatus Melainabacteria bacterium]|nr:hypothetical protein [Candidatus Melainabacteria bacterium]